MATSGTQNDTNDVSDAEKDSTIDREEDAIAVRPLRVAVLLFRYVVEVSDNKIQALTKVHLTKSKLDILRKLILEDKCEGKSPQECEAILEMGSPILAARSEKSGKLVQLYDSGGIEIEGISEPTYCRLWYDEREVFEDLEIITATSSTKQEPTE